MTTVYDKTDNYGLNLYGDSDPADLRDGYNGSMRTIDTTLETHLNRIEGVESRETHDEEVVKALIGDNTVEDATAAKTKWDKAGVDATAATATATNAAGKADNNSAILAALGVTSESTAQQLKDTINTKANTSDVYTRGQADTTFTKQGGYSGTAQQLNQRIQALEDSPQDALPICLCIGDSYANSTSTVNADGTDATKWPTQLRNIIGNDYQVKNYAVTGAGFNVSGRTFTDQINNAYGAPAIDNDNVAIIIIGGGRNDIGTTSQMKSYADTTFSNARTKFPKARIISVPMLWHNAGIDMYGRQKAAGVAEAAAANGVENVDWAWTWNIGNDSNFPAGDVHPNANGAKVIASYMASAIRGTYTGRYEAATVQSSNGHVRSNVVASGGMVFATLWGDDEATNGDLNEGVTFPSWARASNGSSPDGFRVWGAGFTNSGSAVSGWILTGVDGSTTSAPKITYSGSTAGGNNGCFACYPW